MEKLHVGKLTQEVKTTVTEDMQEHMQLMARAARCTPSDIQRDAIYMFLTGLTYADHVAKDRRSVMQIQRRTESDISTGKPEVKP